MRVLRFFSILKVTLCTRKINELWNISFAYPKYFLVSIFYSSFQYIQKFHKNNLDMFQKEFDFYIFSRKQYCSQFHCFNLEIFWHFLRLVFKISDKYWWLFDEWLFNLQYVLVISASHSPFWAILNFEMPIKLFLR